MAEQWRRFREKLRLCDPIVDIGDLDGSEILPIIVGEATRWIRLDRLITLARSLSPPTPAPAVQALPSGTVVASVATLPTGWLKCDGAAVSRTQYPTLFAAIGIKFGKGDGSTTFRLPDMKIRLTTGSSPDATWIIAV